MKSIFLALALCISFDLCFSQTYSIKEYLSKNCKDAPCVQSFFESKGFGKKVIWDNDPVMVREEQILNRSGVTGSTNVVRGGITDNDLYCLFGTNDKTTFDNLLAEATQLGFRQNAYRNEEYGETKFYQAENYKGYSLGAAAVVKGSGTYQFKYWVSIRKFKVIIKKDPNSELFAQLQKAAKPQKYTSNAHKLFYYEKFISAEAEAKKNMKANPGSAEDHYWLILSQLELKKMNEAKSNLDVASMGIKNNPLIQVAKGHILLGENKKEDAWKLFDAALKTDDDKNGLIRIAITRAYANSTLKQGDEAFGLQVIKQAAEGGISNPEILVLLGTLFKSIGFYNDAFMAYQLAAKVDPSYAKAYYMNGKSFQAQGNEEFMNRYFNDAIKADPQYAPTYLTLHQYYSYRDMNKGIEYLTQYLKYSDPDCDNHLYAADYLFKSGKYKESLAKAQEIEKGICKDNPLIKVMKAYGYKMLDDSVQAKNLMEEFISASPAAKIRSADYLFAAELNAMFKGAEPIAEKYFQKAIDKDTSQYMKIKSAQACVAMFEKIKNFKKTAEWYQKIVNMKSEPSNIDLFKLGIAYYNSTEYNNSKKVFETYSQKYPADWRGPLWQARSFSRLDSTMTVGAATPYYEKFIVLGATDPIAAQSMIEAYFYLCAYQYNTKKNKTTALEYLNKILAIDPNNTNAKKYKETITASAN